MLKIAEPTIMRERGIVMLVEGSMKKEKSKAGLQMSKNVNVCPKTRLG